MLGSDALCAGQLGSGGTPSLSLWSISSMETCGGSPFVVQRQRREVGHGRPKASDLQLHGVTSKRQLGRADVVSERPTENALFMYADEAAIDC